MRDKFSARKILNDWLIPLKKVKQLEVGDHLVFKDLNCTGCGGCCQDFTKDWITSLPPKGVKVCPIDFPVGDDTVVNVYSYQNEKVGMCDFFEKVGSCLIYKERPLHCKIYPLKLGVDSLNRGLLFWKIEQNFFDWWITPTLPSLTLPCLFKRRENFDSLIEVLKEIEYHYTCFFGGNSILSKITKEALDDGKRLFEVDG